MSASCPSRVFQLRCVVAKTGVPIETGPHRQVLRKLIDVVIALGLEGLSPKGLGDDPESIVSVATIGLAALFAAKLADCVVMH